MRSERASATFDLRMRELVGRERRLLQELQQRLALVAARGEAEDALGAEPVARLLAQRHLRQQEAAEELVDSRGRAQSSPRALLGSHEGGDSRWPAEDTGASVSGSRFEVKWKCRYFSPTGPTPECADAPRDTIDMVPIAHGNAVPSNAGSMATANTALR